uniref:ubiquitinyl hydrolase 1 n=1 Tax=Ciona savignyi TaxID=51511 RepID=H2ZHP0_CIOSA
VMDFPRDLYIAKSLKELNKHANCDSDTGRSVKSQLTFANKAFGEAEKAFKNFDEERAYILYMKYLDLVGKIRKSSEFKKDPKHYSLLLGKVSIDKALTNAEKTSVSLKKRYNALVNKSNEPKTKPEENVKVKENGASEKKQDKPAADMKVQDNESYDNHISCAKLYEMIRKTSKNVLILDIRTAEDFQLSRIQHSNSVNVPKSAIKPGSVVSKIELGIGPEHMEAWNARDSVDIVVLVDWWASVERLEDKGDPLRSLKDAIWKWNQNKILRHEPIVLEGGFADWLEFYPQFTTNPRVKVPKQEVKTLNVNSLLEFSYKPVEEIVVPPKSASTDTSTVKTNLGITGVKPPTQSYITPSPIKPLPKPDVTSKPNIQVSSKKPVPGFDRSKKPSLLPLNLQPPDLKPENKIQEVEPKLEPAIKETTKSLPGISESNSKLFEEDSLLIEYENRISLMKKQKEERESAIAEIEKKKKVAELQAQEKKMKEEAIEAEKRKAKAEHQLAITMRGLMKPKAGAPVESEHSKTPSTDEKPNDSIHIEPIYAEVKKVNIAKDTSVVRENKPKVVRPDRPTAEKPDVTKPKDSGTSEAIKSIPTQIKPKLSQSTPEITKTTELSDTTSKIIYSTKPTLSTGLKPNSDKQGFALKRSSSSPNIAKLVDQELNTPTVPAIPNIPSRNQKPSLRTGPSELVTALTHSLRGVYGGKGRGLCGLRNLGNSCYMNSVLQCMFNMTQLAEYILSNSYTRDLNRVNAIGHGGKVAESFSVLLRAVWSSKYEFIVPSDFKYIIGNINPIFAGLTQEDSQEFLMLLLDGLHEDLNKASPSEYKEEPDNDALDDDEAAKLAWKYHKRRNESIIVELLKGQFKATVKCLHCGKVSRKFDPFMFLSLPLPQKSSSVYDILNSFQKVEKMTGSDRWHCPSCKTLRDAVRSIVIWKLPPVLIIHFKRFVHTGRWRDKIHTNISYPISQLDLNRFISSSQKRPKYDLFAVSHHQGAGLDSGHYTASCKSVLDNNWYKFDDTEVMRTSAPQGPTASILFYCS